MNVLVGETPLPRDPYLGGQSTFIWRMNAHITFQHDLFVSKDHNNFGYVRVDNGHVVIGRRNINVTDNALSVIYNLTARMNINLRARHYWTKVVYNRFYYLNDNGRLTQFANVVPADFNYNVFNVDCVYSWQFAPGSFLNLIWKNNITQDDTESGNRYLENFRRTLQTPQANSVIIKLIYYLEYQQLRKALGMQKHHHLPSARQ